MTTARQAAQGHRWLPKIAKRKRYVTAQQAADAVGVCVDTIRRWAVGGQLPIKLLLVRSDDGLTRWQPHYELKDVLGYAGKLEEHQGGNIDLPPD